MKPHARRRVNVTCPVSLVADIFKHGTHETRVVRDGIPVDAVHIGTHFDVERQVFIFAFEHESFGLVADGSVTPYREPIFEIVVRERANQPKETK